MKFLTLAAALLMAVMSPAPAAAQDAGDTGTITVTGSGEASGAPDRATINAGVQTMAPTPGESAQQNQAAIERIMAVLEDEGIDRKNIQTVDYSIWPQYQQDPRGNGEATIVGYRVNNTVRITVDDIGRLGDILAAVTEAGANTINGISFSVADTAALEEEARALAMADARTRAAALAGLAGVELGRVLRITTSPGGAYPVASLGGAMAMAEARFNAPPSISGGELSVSVQVQVTWEIQ